MAMLKGSQTEAKLKTAREEGLDEIADGFAILAQAERSHANRYAKALEQLQDGRGHLAAMQLTGRITRRKPRSTR